MVGFSRILLGNLWVGLGRFGLGWVILDVHVVGLLCLVGFIGNALTIAVLRRDWQDGSNATNWLLRTLAGVDTFYLIACLFVQTFNTTHDLTDWFPGALRPYFPYAERYMWPVASIAQTVAIWTVLLVTVDRYMAVCRRAGKVTVGLAAMRHFVTAGSWPSVGM